MPSPVGFRHFPFPRAATPPPPGMAGRQALAGALLASALALERACRRSPSAVRRPLTSRRGSPFEVAVRFYEDGQWTAAFEAAAAQADGGEPWAARLALLMLRHGAPLYGIGFSADPRRVAQWAKSVIRAKVELEAAPRPALIPVELDLRASAPQRDARSTSRRTASPSSMTAMA